LALLVTSLVDPSVKLRFEGDKGVLRWRDRVVSVEVRGLPALPAGKVYQLWHIGLRGAVPCRTFTLDAAGLLEGEDTMKDAVALGHKFALTVEPAGGSLTPTMPIVAITQ
jgi:anti-sigma-K factor RskA